MRRASIYTGAMSDSHENVKTGAVAVLGAGGTMGRGMARNAAAADIPTQVWNRTAAKLGDLAEIPGIEAFDTAREAVADVEVVVTILSDADATIAAMSGPDGGAAGSEGAVWVQMGTIGVEGSDRCAELARERGLVYVDAPVLGTKKPAEEGQLVVLASGPEEAARAARAVPRRGRQTDDLARRGGCRLAAEGGHQQLALRGHRGHRRDAPPGRRRSGSNRTWRSTRSRKARSKPPTCG